MSALFTFDQNLHEVAVDPSLMEHKISELKKLTTAADMTQRTRALGEMGVYLRILGRLEEAEEALDEALLLVLKHALGSRMEVQQQLRLAHVYQWQKRFNVSSKIFKEMTIYCMSEKGLTDLLDCVWQHSGKNLFDQELYAEALRAFNKAYELREKRGAPRDLLESSRFAIQMTEARLNRTYIQ